ncbi:MAG: efflux RND transporter permease subunit, partial [Desulfobacterota bacterium]|nr:efflux RND transporter permease subunit [Thermodesulfobacteriota bacterium]
MTGRVGFAGSLARAFIHSKLTPLFIVASLLMGLGAVLLLPREEEPQIIVPMIDIFVQMPGASAKEVEERVTKPMEKLLWEIPGVEYIYSTSSPGSSMTIVRFYVGQDEEKSIVRLNQKMFANFDLIPAGATQPLIKPRSIDDVPVLALTLWSERYDHFMLRRVAAQIHDELRVTLDKARMAAFGIAPAALVPVLQQSNQQLQAGHFSSGNREYLLETGGFLESAEDLGRVVVGVFNDRPVYLRDVASIVDGPDEPADYVLIGSGRGAGARADQGLSPAVTISVAKRKGTNAIVLADKIIHKVSSLKGWLVPADIHVTVTRNYGETASEKSNELLFHMMIAIFSVAALIWLTLGLRESGIVATAIPVTLALTLSVFFLYRVTLFALIFSIGILVDDAIVVVENMVRHYRMPASRGRPIAEVAVEAVDEVGNPTILATAAVIAAILPMAFVSGLMGPYMRPIPVGASAAMLFSLLVAFVVTPWASLRLLNPEAEAAHTEEGRSTKAYRRVMSALINDPRKRKRFLLAVVLLLLAAISLFAFKAVRVKMLPFDNKSEFQVIIDMPEGSTLEQTAAVTQEMADAVRLIPEVTEVLLYIGTAAPYNFNGLVRHYFLRRDPHSADMRKAQSHDIAKRVRPELERIAARYQARVKVSEVPPGPPVLQTLVAEVYGPDYRRQIQIAREVREVFEKAEGVVDVDWYVEDDQIKFVFDVSREKAALNGVSVEQIAHTLRIAVEGMKVGLIHAPKEKEDVPIHLRLRRSERSSVQDLQALKVMGGKG